MCQNCLFFLLSNYAFHNIDINTLNYLMNSTDWCCQHFVENILLRELSELDGFNIDIDICCH